MVTMSTITTIRTTMLSFTQGFGDCCLALWTDLGCSTGIDPLEVHPTFETHPFQQRQKSTKGSINAVFPQHPPVKPNRVEIFGKDGLRLVTETMRRLQMEIFTSISNVVMQSGYLDLCFLPVMRTLLFSCRSALEQFQLPDERFQEPWALNRGVIRDSQKRSEE